VKHRSLALLIVAVPSLALAQGSPPPEPPPPPPATSPGAPPPPAQPYGAPAPQGGYGTPAPQPPPPPQGPYGQPQGGYGQPQGGYGQPQPGYGQPQPYYGYPQQPAYQQGPRQWRSGVTFEINLGVGRLANSDEDESFTGPAFGIGVGGFVGSKLAISARAFGVGAEDRGVNFSNAWFGPAAQFWVDDHIWFGGGLGVAQFRASFEGESMSVDGFGLDVRGGYTFNDNTDSTFNVSLELNTGSYDEANGTIYGLALMAGYQHL